MIKLSGSLVQEEKQNTITRFLGIWINNNCSEALTKARAKRIVLKLLERTINSIQQPLLRLAKNKVNWASISSNTTLFHRGLRGCNLLENELTIKQISCLINSFNSAGLTEQFTKLRLQKGMCKARIVNNNWLLMEHSKLKYIWKDNLICLTIYKAKSLYLEISNIMLVWSRRSDTKVLNLVLSELFDVKVAKGGKTREKKPKWFSLLKKKIIENAEERTIKPEWTSGQLNQLVLNISLLDIAANKKKKERVLFKKEIRTKIEKCSEYEYNRGIVKENCITRIKFDKSWKVISENVIDKTELRQYSNNGAVVVQVNKKEEMSLEEVSAYTTSWPSSTRAELLTI
ncbi:24667_t:CDS:2 [Gigaspora margarita]|uniref:24667_t:CDS:1 n=1 Tax=Gigaspora margarita TaxID=4874 RepID=A0ABN7UUS7_GIGMA|nr:24667_t:CDS:2 [Gigaspora margarita]